MEERVHVCKMLDFHEQFAVNLPVMYKIPHYIRAASEHERVENDLIWRLSGSCS
uniref:Uncharacterized protein n=1 Tax=Oryza brachyantha TaxID=4533 RepID=J3MZZ9_ORYBR